MKKRKNLTSSIAVSKWILFMLVAVGLTFSSCKDYDDDIDDLNKKITDIKKEITDSKTELTALAASVNSLGKVVKMVEKSATGIKVTYTDNTSTDIVVTGTPGTASVITINAAGFWVIDGIATTTKAAGTNGTNGNTPEIKNGTWWIGGVDTGTPVSGGAGSAGGALVAQASVDGTTIEIGHLDDKGKFVKEISLPLVSQFVSSIVFEPEFLENKVPVILVSSITDGTKVFSANSTLAYRLNPNGVLEKNFAIRGLVEKKAIELKATPTFIPVTKVAYADGLLSVKAAPAALKVRAAASKEEYMYALVLENLNANVTTPAGGVAESPKYIYSDYVTTTGGNILWANVAFGDKSNKTTPLAPFQGTTGGTDYSIVFDGSAAVQITPKSYEGPLATATELAEAAFGITYTYTLAGTNPDKDSFVLDAATGKVTVKSGLGASAIGKKLFVVVEMKMANNAAGETATAKTKQTAAIVIAAKPGASGEEVLVDKTVTYIIGALDITKTDSYNMDLFYDKAGLSQADFNTSAVPSTTIALASAPTVAVAANINLVVDGTNNRIMNLFVGQAVAAEKYIYTRTYTIGAQKFIARYIIDLQMPKVAFNKVAAFWDVNDSQVVFGKEVAGAWKMVGDLKDGFGATVVSLTPNATCGTNLPVVGTPSFTIVPVTPAIPATDIALATAGGVELKANFANYIDKIVKVEVAVNLGTKVEKKEFNITFKRPIKIEFAKVIEFKQTDNTSKLSPYDGLKVTNVALGNLVLTTPAQFAVFFDVSGAVPSTGLAEKQVDSAPYVKSDRVTVALNSVNAGTVAAPVWGSVAWNTSGVTLQSNLQVAYDFKVTTTYGETFDVKEALRVTVKP